MGPKEKVTATSSESTSTSNTSSSSSSSSSSSGTDSSSSDSENSSSSQGSAIKSAVSTDSDKRKGAKKKTTSAKNKNSTGNENESSKGKEKSQGKGRNAKATHYSSESDVPVKPAMKRKPPPKPKATATVTPINKPKQPVLKGKAHASKANNSAQKGERNSRATTNKQTEPAVQKKSKTKSIFSPENSSDSEEPAVLPPKLSPMKSTAKALAQARPKAKATVKTETAPPAVKSNSSVTSSSASSESSDSSSDSDSSADSLAAGKPAKKKACTGRKAPTGPRAAATGASGGTRARPEVQATAKVDSAAAASESEGDTSRGGVVTRKFTRSSSSRRSKHLIGKTSDTESEAEGKGKTAAAKKGGGPKGSGGRCKAKCRVGGGLAAGAAGSEASGSAPSPEEERHCPLGGCSSLGHLGGRLDKHFTVDACPLYHNRTSQQCKELLSDRRRHEEERRKASSVLSKRTGKGPLTAEQRHWQLRIKELRARHRASADAQAEETAPIEEKEREPRLAGLTPDYDLRLFQEAQAAASEKIEQELRLLPHVKGTKYVEMGKFEMEVWYQSPYPEEYARVPKLYICEFCLRYMKSCTILKRHMVKCVWRHPPGEEVYRKEKLSVWEVDGKRYKQYCQNLCLLAKFFLDHKTLYYDVEPFLFYVMTIGDGEGCHTVGYFSKEKNSFLNYNVSCILTLPPYQRQGYGRLLIDFSYLLTRVERKIGSPEKPLSDLGLISYRSYWKDVLLEYLCQFGGKELSIKDLSQEMAINSYDIVSTLQALGMMKYWKGKHIILKKQDVIEEYEERLKRRGCTHKQIDPAFLKWTPFAVPPAAATSAGPT